jgi:hypothetical protein
MISWGVTIFRNSARTALYPARRILRALTPVFAQPNLQFLIANPRLEIAITYTKQTVGITSNREEIAFFFDFPADPPERHGKWANFEIVPSHSPLPAALAIIEPRMRGPL